MYLQYCDNPRRVVSQLLPGIEPFEILPSLISALDEVGGKWVTEEYLLTAVSENEIFDV